MHISCPRCDAVVNAKDYNLFEIWTCEKCDWRFRGVHANQPHIRNLINSFIAPLHTNPTVWDLANCPHCGSLVDLNWIGTHTKTPRDFGYYRHIGYNGPYTCKRCCKSLPWDYPDQFEHVVKQHNERVMKERSEHNSSNTKERKSFVEIAEKLYRNKHNIK